MNLQEVSSSELTQMLLQANDRYLKCVNRPVKEYMNDPTFVVIREEFRLVLNELKRRWASKG